MIEWKDVVLELSLGNGQIEQLDVPAELASDHAISRNADDGVLDVGRAAHRLLDVKVVEIA
ncbi:MAG: hypothetical protein FD153_197 [Rhodospirillaceae bacterium]|nr:MAG: hypothetical protein FD153_197 [Rhodospirillaceae bacterium]